MRKILDRVTITGADDSVDPTDLLRLSKQYPFVEWGILVSEHRTIKQGGGSRFPSVEWLKGLRGIYPIDRGFKLSMHLCGRWVREICKGVNELAMDTRMWYIWDVCRRAQLNFHSYTHLVDGEKFYQLLRAYGNKQFIFQVDGVNDHIVSNAYDEGVDVAALYDRSSGAGKLPHSWPHKMAGIYTGYAGGLSPDNVAEQLALIENVVPEGAEPVWIDTESRVRSGNDTVFDLEKVENFLKNATPWVLL